MPVKNKPSQRNQKAKDKKSSWFQTENKYAKSGPVVVSLVSISKSPGLSKEDSRKRQKRRSLVISVPKACGSAVQRNRFRRIVRARLKDFLAKTLSEDKGLWIRLLNYHRLPRSIRWDDWTKPLNDALVRLGLLDPSSSL